MSSKKKTAAKRKSAKGRTPNRAGTKRTARKRAAQRPKAAAPKVGTVIERVFKGETYRLEATADGFVLGKETFRTLTGAARHVTGYKAVSGPMFWLPKSGGA